MLKAKFDINTLTTQPDLIAQIVPANRLFSMLSKTLALPADWVSLARHKSKDPILTNSGDTYEEDSTIDLLFVRTTPILCTAKESNIQSNDGYECKGTLNLNIQIMLEPAELEAFRKTVIGSHDAVTAADVERYLTPHIINVLKNLAGQYSAEQLLDTLDNSTIQKTINEIIGPAALAGGLTIGSITEIKFDSTAYRDQQQHEAGIQRKHKRLAAKTQIQQALATAQNEKLTHLVKMLEQMQKLSEQHQDLSMADLLGNFNNEERAQMYTALWQLSPVEQLTRYVAIVSGSQVLLFEPTNFEKPARTIELPDTLGRLRSVNVDAHSLQKNQILVGAATGVFLLDIESGQVAQSLPAEIDENTTVQGGINAAATSNSAIFATHSQLGLMSWQRENETYLYRPLCSELTKPADTVRCATVANDAVWFACDEQLYTLPLDKMNETQPIPYTGSTSPISAITIYESNIYAGNTEGQILAWDMDEPNSPQVIRSKSSGPVESISLIEIGGVDHLIAADRSDALPAIVPSDNYTRRYQSPSLIIRRAAVNPDLFAAINDNRDRLIIWNPKQPKKTTTTTTIPHITGNSIQDLCLIPNT